MRRRKTGTLEIQLAEQTETRTRIEAQIETAEARVAELRALETTVAERETSHWVNGREDEARTVRSEHDADVARAVEDLKRARRMGRELDRQLHQTEVAVASARGEQAARDATATLKARRQASDALRDALSHAAHAASALERARGVAGEALDAAAALGAPVEFPTDADEEAFDAGTEKLVAMIEAGPLTPTVDAVHMARRQEDSDRSIVQQALTDVGWRGVEATLEQLPERLRSEAEPLLRQRHDEIREQHEHAADARRFTRIRA